MGIEIRYKGSLDDPSRLDDALEAIRAFCRRAGWRFEELSEQYSRVLIVRQEVADGDEEDPTDPEPMPPLTDANRYGDLTISARVSRNRPPDLIEETCRGLFVDVAELGRLELRFNGRGRLCQYYELSPRVIHNAIPDTVHYIAYPLWAVTSGRWQGHVNLCELFRMLKKNFMSNLAVEDDTGYWDSGDLAKLRGEHWVMEAFSAPLKDPEVVRALVGIDKDATITAVNEADVAKGPKKKAKAKAVS